MRRGPVADGWAGSLFPEPIDQVKAPSDRCVCHQDCPQYETCETEALDKNSKVYYLLRCVKGKFPACANCMCMSCDRYHECKDGETDLRGGVRYRLCNRPISITGCLDYSGSIPWRSEAYCKECDHICDLRKELIWAPRVRCDLNPIEPTKKPTEEPSPVQLDGGWHNVTIIDNVVKVDGVICDDNFVPLTQPFPKPAKAKKQPKVPRVSYPDNDGCDKCLCSTCLNEKVCQKCEGMNEICSAHGHPHTIGCPAYSKAEGEGWTCPDCLCPQCANKGQSCHTCEGPVYCTKHGGKMGGCPDFRAKDGEEQLTVPVKATKQPKPKKQPKLTRADYDANPLPGSNADICSHCDCETCGLNQAHLNYTDKEWKGCPPCGCDQCLGKDDLQPKTLCGRKSSLMADVMGNTESCLPREQLHVDTVQRYVRPSECAKGSCTACQCHTCGYRNLNCALNGDEPVLICSTCWLDHPHHWEVYAAIVKKCAHWRDAATFPADVLAPGMGPCPETACELRYNGEGGPCLCHSCKYGPGSCDTSCNIPGYPMETGQYGCEWYAKKEVATVEVPALPAAELDVPELVKVGDLVTTLHIRTFTGSILKVTRVKKEAAGWQIYGDLWDDFRHPKRKLVRKNERLTRWEHYAWKAEGDKIVVAQRDTTINVAYDSMHGDVHADDQVIVLSEEQVKQLCATEEQEDIIAPTWYTRVYLKLAGAKGTLNDLHSDWPLLGHARFVDTSAAAVAKIPSGRRAEVCQDEPECEQCHCHTCQHQKNCRLDNTLNCCSPCKTSGGAHHHKAVDCEGYQTT